MRKIFYFFFASLLVFLQLLNPGLIVNAAKDNITTVKGYSDVVDDLINFNIDVTSIDYSEDVSLIHFTQVFNEKNQLQTFIYFAVSDANTEISKVNLSTSLKKVDTIFEENYQFYDLILISYNANEKLRKYEINQLTNNEETRRYALVSALYRKEGQSTDLVKTLATEYYFHGNSNETLEGYNQYLETITITDKEIYLYCYGDSLSFFGINTDLYKRNSNYTDAWFLFFNTDRKIDSLLEIEIDYGSFEYCLPVTNGTNKMDDLIDLSKANQLKQNPPFSHVSYKDKFSVIEKENQQVTVKPGTTIVESSSSSWFGKYETHYAELDNIVDLRKYSSSGDFIFKEQAKKYTWAVNFLNTNKKIEDVVSSIDNVPWLIKGTGTNDICILRLKFLTNNQLYNLGAVDVPKDPTGAIAVPADKDDGWSNILKIIAIFFGLIFFFSFILPLIKEFVKLVVNLRKN